MKKFNYDPDDLIVALATPWAESALAIIRTSGKGSIEKTDEITKTCRPRCRDYSQRGNRLHQRVWES